METTPNSHLKNSDPRLANLSWHALLHFGILIFSYFIFFYVTSFASFDKPFFHEVAKLASSIILGVITTMVFHEWFHLAGARISSSTFTIPKRIGVFIFEWDFSKNNTRQFYIMSAAGSFGGFLAILFLAIGLTQANWGYSLVLSSAFSAFIFGAAIEWPVILRTLVSKDPYLELSRITPKVLIICLLIAVFSGLGISSVTQLFFN